jgi:hypothetical protein
MAVGPRAGQKRNPPCKPGPVGSRVFHPGELQ